MQDAAIELAKRDVIVAHPGSASRVEAMSTVRADSLNLRSEWVQVRASGGEAAREGMPLGYKCLRAARLNGDEVAEVLADSQPIGGNRRS